MCIATATLATCPPCSAMAVLMAKRARKGMVGSARPESRVKSCKGHGGACDGAGRRPVLNEDQRSWIGAYYQNCWEKLIRGLARLRQRSVAIKNAIGSQGAAGKGALSQLPANDASRCRGGHASTLPGSVAPLSFFPPSREGRAGNLDLRATGNRRP
jgi:hypothetical protein